MVDADKRENFERALDDYKNATSQVSELIKYIGFGLLAAFYTTRGDVAALPAESWLREVHLATGLCAALIIFSDYLHYIFASRASHEAIRNGDHGYQYDKRSSSYRLRTTFYYLKQGMTALGSGLVVVLILYL